MIIQIPAGRATFNHLQTLNEAIYGVQNGRVYSAEQMCMKIMRYSTMAIKGIRKGKPTDVRNGLVMAFSWVMAFSNRLKIDLDMEVWKRFPGFCPYCGTVPCSCQERASHRQSNDKQEQNIIKAIFVVQFQLMFKNIYPQNTIKDAGFHLAEEVAELTEAYMDYMARHSDSDFEEVLIELVDVIANLFAVANTMSEIQTFSIILTNHYLDTFGNGCPKCQMGSCSCGFTVTANSITTS
jgi:NTP pyrophosphatase (non-canonical NTP hydrolase)